MFENVVCPRHGGPWGSDLNCADCVDIDGRVRTVPPANRMRVLEQDVYLIAIQISAESVEEAYAAYAAALDFVEQDDNATDYRGALIPGRRVTNDDVRAELNLVSIAGQIEIIERDER